MQTYVESTTNLNQKFYIRLLAELITLLSDSNNDVLKVIKTFYGIPKAGNHWFATYYIHHKKKLGMTESTYDPCFFYRSGPLGIIGMQTNNTLILADNNFANKEEKTVKNAKIMTKDWKYLTPA